MIIETLAHMDAPAAFAAVGVALAVAAPTCFYFATRISRRYLDLRHIELKKEVELVQAKGALTRLEHHSE